MHLGWENIDLRQRVLRVQAKPQWGFSPKDAEERTIPLEGDLAVRLERWARKRKGTRLVFGTRSDLPNNHLLMACKRTARRAGLNCGQCQTCREKNECERWFLHRFRATFATKCLQGGMDLVTVQRLLGHSDLKSTMRYLVPARGASVQARVNGIFAQSGEA